MSSRSGVSAFAEAGGSGIQNLVVRNLVVIHVLRGGNGCAGRWAVKRGPDVRRLAKNGAQPLTTNLSADSVSESNGESEDDERKNESNQDFHSEISLSVYGA